MARTPIGLKIREGRRSAGLTQAVLADKVGISASYLNLIEHDKRPIGGRLLKRIAETLAVPVDYLDGEAERRLIGQIEEIAADPAFSQRDLTPETAAAIVGRHPQWARLVVALHRAYLDRSAAVRALSERMSQDPFLAGAVHGMLSNIAAIRSTSELLASVDDMPADQQRRFHGNLASESARLSEVAASLAAYFDAANAETRSITPAEEVDDFFLDNQNHFPAVEIAIEKLRGRLTGAGSSASDDLERAIVDRLAAGHGFAVTAFSEIPDVDRESHVRYDRARRLLEIRDVAPPSTRRFAMARLLVSYELRETIEETLLSSDLLTSDASLTRARRAVRSYAAAALLMPYDAFRAVAKRVRYDVDALCHRFAASPEQVSHRLVSLRRPGAEGVPFAFMRADPSGYVTKRLPLRGLPMPRQGGACPLWVVYRAFQTPDRYVRQMAEFPDGGRFLMFARTVAKEGAGLGPHRHLLSIMLACDALYADDVVYGDGLDAGSRSALAKVGSTCRLCPRSDCRQRQEDPIVNP